MKNNYWHIQLHPDDRGSFDTEKIKNVTAIINQFSNVVAKNFCVYANYNDFSFANGRSSEDMNQKLTEFFG